MRNEFEKLRLIQVAIDNNGAYWCDDKCGYTGYDCDFVNGAWYAYQELQKRIDEKSKLINKILLELHVAHMSDGNSSIEILNDRIQDLLK